MIAIIIQLIGTFIPVAGIAALLRNNESNPPALRLIAANIGCIIMNSAYFLMAISENEDRAASAMKMEAAGNAVFFLFFVLFLSSYQRMKINKLFLGFWFALECAYVGCFWVEAVRENILGVFTYEYSEALSMYTVHIEPKLLYLLRYSLIAFMLSLGTIVTTIKMFRTKLISERYNLAILVGSQFVICVAFNIQLILNPSFNIVPIFASLSILALSMRLLRNDFFGITYSGREWVFEQMENAYILVDNTYGYLDSNNAAADIFGEIQGYHLYRRIPERLYEIFLSEDTDLKVGDRIYKKKITQIKKGDSVQGYAMLLEDITDQTKYIAFINKYNEELAEEVRRQTEHITAVQDSVITGIASVVESRDNSTGGHINRTSHVVRIFAGQLQRHPELDISEEFLSRVTKAAPMHDLGKVAVDDVVLRKPGKFSDEEYEKMKKHSAEGARMLETVLAKVDDEEFKKVAINVAHFHHERYDGRGYPTGLCGEDIPIEARIMALADVFDALVSKRCYKEAFTYDKAVSIIEEGLGTQFDPVLGRIFIECRSELEELYDSLLEQ